jgi:DNA mismatch repair protein MutS2
MCVRSGQSARIPRERALTLDLSRDETLVALRLQETDDAVRLLQREPPPPVRGFEPRPALQKATKGGVLSPDELLSVQRLLQTARLYKSHLLPRAERYPHLARHAERLHTLHALEKQIAQCIAPSGEVLDTASERLAQLRRDQQRLHRRITEELQRLIHSLRDALQEPHYTIRGGRYCLPVRSDSRGRVKGIVHDSSASGATLFVEPEPLIELGNRLRELHAAERDEIDAILYGLSRAVEAETDTLGETLDALTHLDAALAAGRLALDWDCTMPVLNTQGEWKLRKARHPMIPRAQAQPIDIELGREWLGVLITGPNTGGKTVSLKTLGLLTLMTLLGLHIPAWRGRASPSRTASTPTSATNRACSSRCPPFQGTCGTSSATWRRRVGTASCCWMNSARVPTRRKARRWRALSCRRCWSARRAWSPPPTTAN